MSPALRLTLLAMQIAAALYAAGDLPEGALGWTQPGAALLSLLFAGLARPGAQLTAPFIKQKRPSRLRASGTSETPFDLALTGSSAGAASLMIYSLVSEVSAASVLAMVVIGGLVGAVAGVLQRRRSTRP